MNRQFLSALAVLVGIGCLGGFLSGCNKRSQGVAVNGTVAYKGKPVTGGKITFHPKAGGPPYTAEILYDGTFVGRDVPVLGEVIVTIDTSHLKGFEGPILNPFEEAKSKGEDIKKADPSMIKNQKENVLVAAGKAPKYVEIPAKYTKKEQSDLTWEIKAGSNPAKAFDLN